VVVLLAALLKVTSEKNAMIAQPINKAGKPYTLKILLIYKFELLPAM
jgi:hypothetical protein